MDAMALLIVWFFLLIIPTPKFVNSEFMPVILGQPVLLRWVVQLEGVLEYLYFEMEGIINHISAILFLESERERERERERGQ